MFGDCCRLWIFMVVLCLFLMPDGCETIWSNNMMLVGESSTRPWSMPQCIATKRIGGMSWMNCPELPLPTSKIPVVSDDQSQARFAGLLRTDWFLCLIFFIIQGIPFARTPRLWLCFFANLSIKNCFLPSNGGICVPHVIVSDRHGFNKKTLLQWNVLPFHEYCRGNSWFWPLRFPVQNTCQRVCDGWSVSTCLNHTAR